MDEKDQAHKEQEGNQGVAQAASAPPERRDVPGWASDLREVSGKLHALLASEPKHEALRIIHDELKLALAAWDRAIAEATND